MRARKVMAVAALAILATTACGRQKKTKYLSGAAPAVAGSYAQSCRNITALPGGFMSAECADIQGRFDVSYIQVAACKGDIGNNNGLLVCTGATGTTTPPGETSPSDLSASDAASSQAVTLKP